MPGLKTIYTPDGYAVADIKAAVTRSSLLNEVGEAVFAIPTSSVKCREDVLRFGNFLYCKNDSLADWVGVIDTPRTWKSGYVEVHAFEVPFLLQYRLPLLNQIVSGTPGERFTALITSANSKTDTLLRAGTVSTAGVTGTEVLTDTIYSQLKSLSTIHGFDWICSPVIDASGRLSITIDWMQKGGVETDLELSQGHNIMYGDTPLEEAGELINFVEGTSTIEGETSAQIVASYGENAPFGLREKRVAFDGITEITTLQYNCTQQVKAGINPTYGTPLTAINIGSTFRNIRLRNIARYRYNNVGFTGGGLGFTGNVRIEGYMFNEAVGTCELFTGQVTA